jgi:hypothetical protein
VIIAPRHGESRGGCLGVRSAECGVRSAERGVSTFGRLSHNRLRFRPLAIRLLSACDPHAIRRRSIPGRHSCVNAIPDAKTRNRKTPKPGLAFTIGFHKLG